MAKTTKEMPEKLLYSRRETAYVLSISLRSVDKMIADKRLGRRLLAGRVLVPASDVRRASRQDDLPKPMEVAHGRV